MGTSYPENARLRCHLGHSFLPDVTPEHAGANLARIAAGADLALYAHYSTDTVGHRRTMDEAVAAFETVDGFLGGILAGLPAGHSLLVASDHGNIEDMPVTYVWTTLRATLGPLQTLHSVHIATSRFQSSRQHHPRPWP